MEEVPTDHSARPMSAFFPDRPTTNNGREREGRREGEKEGGRREEARGRAGERGNEQRSHVKCAVCGRATHRDRSRHSSARIMLYFTLWMRGRCFLTTNLCSLQISFSFPPSFSLYSTPHLTLHVSPCDSNGVHDSEWNFFRPDDENQLCRPLMYSLRRP